MTATITPGLISRITEVVDAGLTAGLGNPVPGQMCIEAAVCYALGEPHGDRPTCVGDAVQAYMTTINDGPWSSDEARAAGMRRAAVAQLGSDTLDQVEFARRLALAAVQRILPPVLEAAGLDEPLIRACRKAQDLPAARAAAGTAWAAVPAADDAAYSTVAYALAASIDAAEAYEATDATALTADAINGAALATIEDGAEATVEDATLAYAVDMLVDVLTDMGSPGCAYLHLT